MDGSCKLSFATVTAGVHHWEGLVSRSGRTGLVPPGDRVFGSGDYALCLKWNMVLN
jgi:hypothetical protein